MGYLNLEEYIRTAPDHPQKEYTSHDLKQFICKRGPQVVEELVEKMDLPFSHNWY